MNNRELASVILLGVVLGAACLSSGVRSSLWSVIRSALAPRLLIVWFIYGALISATTVGLHKIGLDYDDSTKDAVVWGVIAGLPLLFKFNTVHREPSLMRETLVAAVRATALVEFFVNLYVFPLWVELLLQPFVALILMTSTVAEADEGTKPAKKLLDGISTVGGLVILFVVARHLLQYHDRIKPWPTLLSFTQPVVLSIVVCAFTYAVALVSSYELAFFRIGWRQPSRRRRMRAQLALLVTLHLRLHKVHNFAGTLPRRLADTTSWRGARELVRAHRVGAIAPFQADDLADVTTVHRSVGVDMPVSPTCPQTTMHSPQ